MFFIVSISVLILCINCASVKVATKVQDFLTGSKLVAIAIISIGGIYKMASGEFTWLSAIIKPLYKPEGNGSNLIRGPSLSLPEYILIHGAQLSFLIYLYPVDKCSSTVHICCVLSIIAPLWYIIPLTLQVWPLAHINRETCANGQPMKSFSRWIMCKNLSVIGHLKWFYCSS